LVFQILFEKGEPGETRRIPANLAVRHMAEHLVDVDST
jgi:hypothetical protein